MARIVWNNKVVAAIAGGVDETLGYMDERQARTEPFKTWTDWGRVVLALAAYGSELWGFLPGNIATPLGTVQTALVTKSVVTLIRSRVGAGTPVAAAMVTRATARPSGRVGWRPQPVGV